MALDRSISTTAEAPSHKAHALPAVMVPSFFEDRRELSQRFGGHARPVDFLFLHVRDVASSSFDPHVNDLIGESARLHSRLGFVVRFGGISVLIFSRDAFLFGQPFGDLAHEASTERTPESVLLHQVDEFAIAHAVAPARPLQRIWDPTRAFSSANQHRNPHRRP